MPTTFFGWIGFLLEKYGMLFLQGTGVTVLIALTGTILGFALGLLVAIVRSTVLSSGAGTVKRALLRAAKWLLGVYIEVFRGTPMMVQAMVIYYGAMQYLGISMPFLPAGILIVSVNTGAYMAEIIRGGIISVDAGQSEAAHSIGMSHWQTMTNVILPQAVRNIMPSIGNELIVNIKDSSVLNVISVSELFFQTKSASGTYFRFFESFAIAGVIYLILTLLVKQLLSWLERKMDGPSTYRVYGSQSTSGPVVEVEGGSKRA